MRPFWLRYRRTCVALSQGGITLGILQGLSLVNFASLITSLLSSWVGILASLLFGGDPFATTGF